MSNEEVSVGTREGGEAGTAFLREDCHGDLGIAHAAFALLHSPGSRGAG
jgi:hypothetical protein